MEKINNFDIASTLAQHTDNSFWFIFAVSLVCLVGITVFMLYCCVRYNHKNNPKATQIHGSLLLEVMWTVIPTIIVMFMFAITWEGYKISREVPAGAYEIDVTASQWMWAYKYKRADGKGTFEYTSNSRPAEEKGEGNFRVLNEPKSDVLFKKWIPMLVVPINKPIKLNLYSKDVIHSFSATAFRVKMDCMPKPSWQKPNYLWFEAIKEGIYDVNCTEFCGKDHSQMNSYIKVVSQKEFDKWLEEMSGYYQRLEASNPGFVIWQNNCSGCHTTDGNSLTAPTFKGLLSRNRNVTTSAGKSIPNVKADLEYIKESIRKPKAKIVEGFQPIMSDIFGGYTDEQIQQIYDYLETIK